MAIEFYKEFGEYGYLASYSNHGFTVDNIFYPTVEHFYQASKYNDIDLRNKIINCKTPKDASIIGRDRNNKRIDDFNKIKLDMMYKGVYEKFRQNPDILDKLLNTGDEEIREMTTKESYWGVGPQLDGENHMGIILMKVREQLRNEK